MKRIKSNDGNIVGITFVREGIEIIEMTQDGDIKDNYTISDKEFLTMMRIYRECDTKITVN